MTTSGVKALIPKMNTTEKSEFRLLRESLDRADAMANAQARTITALELALAECQKSRDGLQVICAGQQRKLAELGA